MTLKVTTFDVNPEGYPKQWSKGVVVEGETVWADPACEGIKFSVTQNAKGFAIWSIRPVGKAAGFDMFEHFGVKMTRETVAQLGRALLELAGETQ